MLKKRTLSIDEYLLNIDKTQSITQRDFSAFQTKHLRACLSSDLTKLKNLNFKKTIQLKALKEQAKAFPSFFLSRVEEKSQKEKLLQDIKECEDKVNTETRYSLKLNKMLASIQEAVVDQKVKNFELENMLKKFIAEHEKLLNVTSSASNMKTLAKNHLARYLKSSKQVSNDFKASLVDKRNEKITLENLIKFKADQLYFKEKKSEEILAKKTVFKKKINDQIEKIEQQSVLSLDIEKKLETYFEAFQIIFKNIGYSGDITEEAADIIIEKLNVFMFRKNSMSEQYIHLSQLHSCKVDELNSLLKHLSELIKDTDCYKPDYKIPTTFNILKHDLECPVKTSDIRPENDLIRVYGNTLSLINKNLFQLNRLAEKLGHSVSAKRLIKDLSNSLSNFKKPGKRTLLKAVSHYSSAVESEISLIKPEKILIEQEILKMYPKELEKASLISSLMESSPIVKFFLNFQLLEKYLLHENLVQDLPSVFQSCFHRLQDQYSAVMRIFTDLLLDLKTCPVTVESDNRHSVAESRRNCLFVRPSYTFNHPISSLSLNKKKRIPNVVNSELITIEYLQNKIESLRKCHTKALKSSESTGNILPGLSVHKKKKSI